MGPSVAGGVCHRSCYDPEVACKSVSRSGLAGDRVPARTLPPPSHSTTLTATSWDLPSPLLFARDIYPSLVRFRLVRRDDFPVGKALVLPSAEGACEAPPSLCECECGKETVFADSRSSSSL